MVRPGGRAGGLRRVVVLAGRGSRVGQGHQGRHEARLGQNRWVDPVGNPWSSARVACVWLVASARSDSVWMSRSACAPARASRMSYERANSRCWAPSCRSRSSRRRSASPVSTMRTRSALHGELGEHLGLQPFILQGEPDRGTDRTLQVGQRSGVGDDRDPTAVPNQHGEHPSGCVAPARRPAGRRHPHSAGRQAAGRRSEARDHRRLGERRLRKPGGGAWPRLVADPGDGAALDPNADGGPHQPGGEQDHRRAAHDEDGAEGRVGWILPRYPLSAVMYAMVPAASEADGDRQQRASSRPRVPAPPGADGCQRRRGSRGEPAATSIPYARSGSERSRKRLSMQLAQQLGSKKGSRKRARPRVASGLQVDGDRHGTHHRSPQLVALRIGQSQVSSSGKVNPAASMARLRTSGGPCPSRPTAARTRPDQRARPDCRSALPCG